MSRTHLVRSILRAPRVRESLVAIGMTLACAGCASASNSAADSGPTRKAVVDFTTCTKPMYPHADLKAGHEGTVHLNFLVEPDGSVGQATVLRSSGFPDMDEAARAAIARCHFQPALAAGKPVRQWTKVQYVWALK